MATHPSAALLTERVPTERQHQLEINMASQYDRCNSRDAFDELRRRDNAGMCEELDRARRNAETRVTR